MSYDINSVTVAGRLTKDVDVKYGKSGTAFSHVSLAVQRDKDNTDFIDVTLFGKSAEHVRDNAGKGAKLVLIGELRQDRWQDKDGNNRSKILVVTNKVEVIAYVQKQENRENVLPKNDSWDSGWNNQSF